VGALTLGLCVHDVVDMLPLPRHVRHDPIDVNVPVLDENLITVLCPTHNRTA
jgi:hypothetical protein